MLVKELTLRRIIREEAVRALHEDDASVPTDPETKTWEEGGYTYTYNLN